MKKAELRKILGISRKTFCKWLRIAGIENTKDKTLTPKQLKIIREKLDID